MHNAACQSLITVSHQKQCAAHRAPEVGARQGLHEELARWFFQQLIVALDFCHKKGIANRDIKLEVETPAATPPPPGTPGRARAAWRGPQHNVASVLAAGPEARRGRGDRSGACRRSAASSRSALCSAPAPLRIERCHKHGK